MARLRCEVTIGVEAADRVNFQQRYPPKAETTGDRCLHRADKFLRVVLVAIAQEMPCCDRHLEQIAVLGFYPLIQIRHRGDEGSLLLPEWRIVALFFNQNSGHVRRSGRL